MTVELLTYVLTVPETRIVAWIAGFLLGVACAGVVSRVMTT